MQQGEGIRVTTVASQGGSITVNVGPNDDQVTVGVLGESSSKTYDVPGNKDVEIPVPDAPPGSVVVVRVGKGSRARRIAVTIVAPSP